MGDQCAVSVTSVVSSFNKSRHLTRFYRIGSPPLGCCWPILLWRDCQIPTQAAGSGDPARARQHKCRPVDQQHSTGGLPPYQTPPILR
jgi:hypothetical protein